jgi:hypothetical protein
VKVVSVLLSAGAALGARADQFRNGLCSVGKVSSVGDDELSDKSESDSL